MDSSFSYIPSGDSDFIIKVGDGINKENHIKVRAIIEEIYRANIPAIIECIPSYNEILVQYDATTMGYKDVLLELKKVTQSASYSNIKKNRIIEVPVLYGGKFGPDLENVSKHAQLTSDEVVVYHSKPDYLVYMLGFTPGFCYLGGLNTKIATPRLDNPRTKISQGSVGIANDQTGIYPIESPGGWQIIGRTPLVLFNPEKKPEFLFEAGNYLRFIAINEDQYYQIEEKVMLGLYELKIVEEEF